MEKTFEIIAVGDVIITTDFINKMESDENCRALISILNQADMVVGNYEGSIIDKRTFKGTSDPLSGFGWLVTDPIAVYGLSKLNFKMFSRANNHATDWGREGMEMTNQKLVEQGFIISGIGENYTDSVIPGISRDFHTFTDEIALYSWTTEIVSDSTAIDKLFDVKSRAGVNALHRHSAIKVGESNFRMLSALAPFIQPDSYPKAVGVDKFSVIPFKNSYIELDTTLPPDSFSIEHTVDKSDSYKILTAISSKRRLLKRPFIICSQHHHGAINNSHEIGQDIQDFCKEVIEAGADMIYGHGPHRTRGIEIVDGKPIFYSLGNFFFTDNTQQYLPRDEWDRYIWKVLNKHIPESKRISLDPYETSVPDFLEWKRQMVFPSRLNFESIIAKCVYEYETHKLKSIELYPIELFFDERDWTWRGIPRLANLTDADRIIDRMIINSSINFGTVIEKRKVVLYGITTYIGIVKI